MAMLPVRADDEEFTPETRDAPPSHFLSQIKFFSMLSEHGISKLESMQFEAGDYKWRLIIYLDGDEIGKKVEHISVYLSMFRTASLPASWEVNAIFSFFLYNHFSDNYFCFRGKARRFHALNSECGISKLMSKKCFTEAANGILRNDKCVFGAEVFVIKKQRVIDETVWVLDPADPYKREWEISDFSKQEIAWYSEEFSAGFYKWKILMYPNGFPPSLRGRYVSIYLECVDSERFGAHKKVRATCLFIFRNRLQDKEDHSMKVSHWYSKWQPRGGYAKFIHC